MQFITGLFGGSGNTILTMIFALGIVVVLIILAVWLLKLLSKFSGNAVRGRNRRLSVVDTLSIDPKRQLVIIRRDDVEHLILTGGPQDVVVETGIAIQEPAQATPQRRPLPAIVTRKPAPAKMPAAAPEPVPESEPASTPPAETTVRRGTRSLRHTGLLRPVSVQDPTVTGQNPDISAEPPADSAKEDDNDKVSEGEALEHETGNPANRP
ncbi:FliO/MopB family protein [Devosia sp. CAU 1758]